MAFDPITGLAQHDGKKLNKLVWLAMLGKCGVETYLWRPEEMDAIFEILKKQEYSRAH